MKRRRWVENDPTSFVHFVKELGETMSQDAIDIRSKIRAAKELPQYARDFFLQDSILRGLLLDPTFNKVVTIGRLRQLGDLPMDEAVMMVETLYRQLELIKPGEDFLTDSERVQLTQW